MLLATVGQIGRWGAFSAAGTTGADSPVSLSVSYGGRMEAFTSCPVEGWAACSNTTVSGSLCFNSDTHQT